jgi:hypothetical protein
MFAEKLEDKDVVIKSRQSKKADNTVTNKKEQKEN